MVSRKCKQCAGAITLNPKNQGEIVYYQSAWFHRDCFEQMCQEHIINDPAHKRKYKTALAQIDRHTLSAMEKMCEICNKDNVYQHIVRNYNLSFVPKDIFVRLDAVYTGRLPGLVKPIPPQDLLDMWRRKQRYLNDVYTRNINSGKYMSGSARVKYDLAILCAKYQSYLDWKEDCRLQAEQTKKNFQEQRKADYTTWRKADKDISGLAQSIFGD